MLTLSVIAFLNHQYKVSSQLYLLVLGGSYGPPPIYIRRGGGHCHPDDLSKIIMMCL